MDPFDQIVLTEPGHTYSLNGVPLKSVTSLVKSLQVPFDADYWAPRKAYQRGITEEEIRAEWEASGRASREKGERVHAHIERVLRGEHNPEKPDPFLELNEALPEERAFDTFWKQVGSKLELYRAEWIVGDVSLGVAGRLDSLCFSPETQLHHIWDWKTGKKFRNTGYQRLLPPFKDLDDCELVCYSLQVSCYRLFVETYTTLRLGDSYILHLEEGGTFRVYKALDLRTRLLSWLGGAL